MSAADKLRERFQFARWAAIPIPEAPDPVDPVIRALFAKLPPVGSVWPEAEQRLWLRAVESAFDLIYGHAEPSP